MAGPGGAKPAKARLHVVAGEVAVTELSFTFNPTEYTIAKSSQWNRPTTSGAKSSTKPQFQGANPQTLQMEIFFDAFESGGEVASKVATLLDWVKPTAASVKKKKPEPPILSFEWGDNQALSGFQGYLKTVSAKYTVFRSDGTPVRATANVTLEEVPTDPRSRTRPRARSTAGRRTSSARVTALPRSPTRSTAIPPCGAAWRRSTTSTTRSAWRPGPGPGSHHRRSASSR